MDKTSGEWLGGFFDAGNFQETLRAAGRRQPSSGAGVSVASRWTRSRSGGAPLGTSGVLTTA